MSGEQQNSQLGQRVKTARNEIGISLSELARRAGLSKSYLSEIERGRTEGIGAEVVRSLSLALGVTADWLLELTDAPRGSQADEGQRVTELLQENRELREWRGRYRQWLAAAPAVLDLAP